jgi:DNA-binding protein Fis
MVPDLRKFLRDVDMSLILSYQGCECEAGASLGCNRKTFNKKMQEFLLVM